MADDAKLLQGVWKPTAGEFGSLPFPAEQLKVMKLTMSEGNYAVDVGGKLDKGTYKFDPTTQPKQMDITGAEGPNKGKTFPAIYEISGDTLRICYDLSGKARPAEFKTTKDTQLFLMTYQRLKE